MTTTTDPTPTSWRQGTTAASSEAAVGSNRVPLASTHARARWSTSARRHRAALLACDVVGGLAGGGAGLLTASLLGTSALWAAVPLALPLATPLAGGFDRLRVDRAASCWSGVVAAALGLLLVLYVGASIAGVLVPPAVALVVVPVAVLVAVLGRLGRAHRLTSRRRDGRDLQRAIVIGASEAGQDFVLRTLRHPEDGVDVVGQVRVPRRQSAGPLPFLGSLSEVADVVAAHDIDLVFVVGALPPADLRRLSWDLAETDADLVLSPGLAEVGAHRLSVLPTTHAWNGAVALAPRRVRNRTKAVIDRVLGSFFLLCAAPVILLTAIIVRATSPGGAFYSQIRVGQGGVPFRMWKLRSMTADADRSRAALLAKNDGDGIIFKQKNDPRVTPIGKIIRRYSIDELPQLWNVVRGDMSLIGPRPALPDEVDQYDELVRRRLLVTPGLTGLWQVSGRSNLSWERAVELDLRYVDNHTLAMDAKVLASTASAVFRASGAY